MSLDLAALIVDHPAKKTLLYSTETRSYKLASHFELKWSTELFFLYIYFIKKYKMLIKFLTLSSPINLYST